MAHSILDVLFLRQQVSIYNVGVTKSDVDHVETKGPGCVCLISMGSMAPDFTRIERYGTFCTEWTLAGAPSRPLKTILGMSRKLCTSDADCVSNHR